MNKEIKLKSEMDIFNNKSLNFGIMCFIQNFQELVLILYNPISLSGLSSQKHSSKSNLRRRN